MIDDQSRAIDGYAARAGMTVVVLAWQASQVSHRRTAPRQPCGSYSLAAASSRARLGLWILPVVVRGRSSADRKTSRTGTL